ncbi:conserved hypothetical protein [Histoplasma capsulatum H143]|uniref:Uncharacterized protein n=1 Tax=Ajellomyces capsulatus (strain H143) TaxID=544712 RepID=C6HLA7_AJECH|nr:conserved hypothetical protein [Histoplasma capsulatum H143]
MTKMDVTTVVTSILEAFGNGRDFFNRIHKKKDLKRSGTDKSKRDLKTHGSRKKKRRNTNDAAVPVRSEDMDDLRIQASLERGPAEIKKEYDTSVQRLGERFKKGDELAQGSLAHTLLILNAGLMKLIASCLSSDGQGYNCAGTVDRRSLLILSDSAAADAITALDELRQRLINASTPAPKSAIIPAGQKGRQRSRSLSRQMPKTESGKNSKAEDRNQPSATTHGTAQKEHGRAITETSVEYGNQRPRVHGNVDSGHPAFAHLQQYGRSPNNEADFQHSGREHRGQQLSSIRREALNNDRTPVAAPSITRVLRKDLPPLSPLVPLSQNLQPPRGRTGAGGGPGAASSISVSSGSTKLGEIPSRGRFTQASSLNPLPPPPAQISQPTGPVVEVGYQRPRVAFNAGLEYWRNLAAGANDGKKSMFEEGRGRK